MKAVQIDKSGQINPYYNTGNLLYPNTTIPEIQPANWFMYSYFVDSLDRLTTLSYLRNVNEPLFLSQRFLSNGQVDHNGKLLNIKDEFEPPIPVGLSREFDFISASYLSSTGKVYVCLQSSVGAAASRCLVEWSCQDTNIWTSEGLG